MAIVKRLDKGATLTYAELDGNFDHLVAEDTAVRAEFAAADALHAALTDNPHSVTATQVGLGNVDNTADLDKPVSTATQTAIDNHVNDTAGAHADSAITFTPDGTGAVATTVQAKLRETVSVKDFGAVGDGTTDDTEAIQAAIDAYKSASETIEGGITSGTIIHFPEGTYIINEPILLYSGITLFGTGVSTVIQSGASWAGTELIALEGTEYNQNVQIENIAFKSSNTSVAAIRQSCPVILRAHLKNIILDVSFGIILDSYAQECNLENIFSYGPIDQLLYLKGNTNRIVGLNKEGDSGSTSDPYVLVAAHTAGDSDQNSFERTTIEGTGSVNKSHIVLNGVSRIVFENTWMECTTSNGVSVDIQDASIGDVSFYGLVGVFPATQLKARNAENVYIDSINADGEPVPIADYFDIDSTANITIGRLITRFGRTHARLLTNRNFKVLSHTNRSAISAPVDGLFYQQTQQDISGQNLFINPSFEAGAYGWTIGATLSTEEYIASEVSEGLMAHLQWDANGSYTVSQSLSIPTALVNRDITISAIVKTTDSTGSVFILADGCGVAATTAYNGAKSDDGWSIISATVRPTTTGTLAIGLYCVSYVSGGHVYIDDMSASFGVQSLVNPSKHKSLELTGNTVLYASAAPTTGTWKKSDVVFSSGADVGENIGWVCVTAGTPGTWAPFGHSVIEGSATYDPAELVDGAGATTTVTVTGAALGDFAEASFSNDLQGITLTAWVSSANTVSVRFQNESGGTLDLGSGTLRARVRKA